MPARPVSDALTVPPSPPDTETPLQVEREGRPARAASVMRVVLAALLVAFLLRTFAVEAYRIPSTSMEETLHVGDFLFVSKLAYGPRLPLTLPPAFDAEARTRFPFRRLPGFGRPERGDVVVFNYPPESGPIDRKMHYIKRVVGLPGDTVEIVDKAVRVNGDAVAPPARSLRLWRLAVLGDGPAEAAVAATGARLLPHRPGGDARLVEATPAEADALAALPGVAAVEPLVRRPGAHGTAAPFPAGAGWTADVYGPLRVPAAGETVPLNDDNWPHYRMAIERYEGAEARRVAGGFEIGGRLVRAYTFRQDYYFVLGDNRDDSADSRSWGFVPADHLVGRAERVYFSWDAEAGRPRWHRTFAPIR